jgi:hypothetical protein
LLVGAYLSLLPMPGYVRLKRKSAFTALALSNYSAASLKRLLYALSVFKAAAKARSSAALVQNHVLSFALLSGG